MPRLFRRLLYVIRQRQMDVNLQEELASHHAMKQAELERLGMSTTEAFSASRRALGNATLAREDARAVWIWQWVDDIGRDIAYALRIVRESPGFSLVVIVTLALGIGANSAVFTLANAVLLRGLPFDEPDRIMYVDSRDTRGRVFGVSVWDFEDWQRASRTFSALALSSPGGPMGISGDELVPERYTGGYISANGFELIGEYARLGRSFNESDGHPDAAAVVLISSRVWRSRYNADPSVIGKVVRVNTFPATIIGVMPEGFNWPFYHDVWMPLSQLPPNFRERGRQYRNYVVYGRLAPGVTREQAQSEMANISAELGGKYPDTNKDVSAVVTPFAERVVTDQFRLLWSLMAAVAFVLLIACTNVAHLLLARGAHRMREIAIRVSLGASRWRVVRQLLAESMLLAFISGGVGVGFAVLLIRWFDRETQNVGKPYWMAFTMDGGVVSFFAAVCLLTGIVFGLVPALQISKATAQELQKDGGRSGSVGLRTRRWTAALMVAELALTLVLLAGAGLMMRSFVNLYQRDVGLETSRLVTTSMILTARKYPSIDTRTAFLRRIEERLNSLADIEAATTTSHLPLFGGLPRQLGIDGKTPLAGERAPAVNMVSVGPRYFDTIGVRLIRGRPLDSQDGSRGHEVAIISDRVATLHFGNDDPIGKRIQLIDDTPGGIQSQWATIVGLVPNVRQLNAQVNVEPDPLVYVPHLQNPAMQGVGSIIVRGRSASDTVMTLLRKEVFALDVDLPLASVLTIDQLLARDRWFGRVFGTMFSIFAGIAVVLAAVGLFAATAYSVNQRRREIGIRMALGATRADVTRQFMRMSMRLAVTGLAIGIVVAVALTRYMSAMLYGVPPHDPATFGAVTLFLLGSVWVATYIPVRRATRIDPMVALRCE